MATPWKLKRLRQCAKCPWKVSTNPHDIPNGYNVDMHAALACTIAPPGELGNGTGIRAMACHEHKPGEEAHCVGWLVNQLGPGNNIPLRIKMMSCTNVAHLKLVGKQHKTFEDTLPPQSGSTKPVRKSRVSKKRERLGSS